jgi:hypothetical protein
MALQGSLSELSLPDVIQLVSVSGKTGSFVISRDDERGMIYLKDGQIVDASVGALRGEHAVYEMAIWSSGEFEFQSGKETDKVTVRKSNANLMMEAARRLDEWRVLSRKIPSLDLVPYFSARDRGQDQVTLSPHEWILVTKVDGTRSIDEIATELRWSAFDVSKLLFGMITSGLVALRSLGEKGDSSSLQEAPSPVTLLGLADRVRGVALQVIGASGERTIDKQYTAARTRIEKGDGLAAIREMIDHNSKAIGLLKGTDMAAMFDEQVRPLLGKLSGG